MQVGHDDLSNSHPNLLTAWITRYMRKSRLHAGSTGGPLAWLELANLGYVLIPPLLLSLSLSGRTGPRSWQTATGGDRAARSRLATGQRTDRFRAGLTGPQSRTVKSLVLCRATAAVLPPADECQAQGETEGRQKPAKAASPWLARSHQIILQFWALFRPCLLPKFFYKI